MGRGYRQAYLIPSEEFHQERLLLQKVSQSTTRKLPRRDKCSNTSSHLEAFHLINFILTQVTIGSGSSHDENALSLILMILIVCNNSYTVQMSKVSSDAQDNCLTVISCKTRKQVTSFQHTMAQNTNWHSKREEWDIMREDWTKARLKPSRATIKSSSSSVSDTWGFSFKEFRWPYPCNFSYIFL